MLVHSPLPATVDSARAIAAPVAASVRPSGSADGAGRAALVVTSIRTADATFDISGAGYDPVGDVTCDGKRIDVSVHAGLDLALRVAAAVSRGEPVLSTDGWVPDGDSADVALLVAARKAGINRADVTGEMPVIGRVTSRRDPRLRATFHRRRSGRTIALVAGPADDVLRRCWCVFAKGQSRPLEPQTLDALLRAEAHMSAHGLRVVALAAGDVTHPSEEALTGLTFVALAALRQTHVADKEAVS